ncbi:hypothetical protein ACH4SP_31025 [Streptomyces sp. NPDC021093]|uniref:hypothetical protein n=1 Tax=Streptomyces sp. NPDC021093 TaxID=3365112 RepID=UPI0037B4AA79
MSGPNDGAALALPVLAVGLVVRRQLTARPVRRTASLVTPAVLGALGLAGLALGIATVVEDHHPLTALPLALLVASLAVAAAFGTARARTVRVWRDPRSRTVLRKGTASTTGLWAASVVTHLLLSLWIDHAAGAGVLGPVSLYAYLAIGLGVQNLLVRGRATAL